MIGAFFEYALGAVNSFVAASGILVQAGMDKVADVMEGGRKSAAGANEAAASSGPSAGARAHAAMQANQARLASTAQTTFASTPRPATQGR